MHPYFSDLTESSKIERLRSTMLSFGSTAKDISKSEKKDKQKVEDSDRIHRKDERDRQNKQNEQNGLPQIQHIKMDLKVNIFNQTGNSAFKKTNWGMFGKKKQP